MHSTTLPFTLPLPADLPCVVDLRALAAHLASLVDHRDPRGVRYPLAPLLTLAVCAKLAGHRRITALADWARLRARDLADLFGLARATLPHPTTWSRLFAEAVDVPALEDALGSFFRTTTVSAEVPARGSRILAVDGKPLRGTIPSGHTTGVHLVAAYLPDTGVVLAQLAVDRKANAIVVVPTLLAHLDLTGMVVVGDAMQTQRHLSLQIVETGGDYLWFVKANQPTLHADIERRFTPLPVLPGTAEAPTDFTMAHQIDNAHGRLEARRITVSSWLQDDSNWPYLAQVFKWERTVGRAGKAGTEVRYGVTSLPATVADAARLLTIARTEWGIENGLHYRRDVRLAEDASRLRRGRGPQVMAALNNAVIGLVLQAGERNLAASQRRVAYHFDRWLAQKAKA
ncbi:MAG TPA: ISAs1 family transposase [Herpetosiphonaceae bacterium]